MPKLLYLKYYIFELWPLLRVVPVQKSVML